MAPFLCIPFIVNGKIALHIQVARTGGQICSLISELLFLLERSWGSHQIQILHRVCLKNFCFFPPSRAPFDVIRD